MAPVRNGNPPGRPPSPRARLLAGGAVVLGLGLLVALLLVSMELWIRLIAMMVVAVGVIVFLASV